MLSDERGTTCMHGGYIAHGIQKFRYWREFSKILRNNAKNGTSIRRLISKNEAFFNSQKKRDDLNVRFARRSQENFFDSRRIDGNHLRISVPFPLSSSARHVEPTLFNRVKRYSTE